MHLKSRVPFAGHTPGLQPALSRELNWAVRNLDVPVWGSGGGDGSPRPQRVPSKDAECAAGCEMALDVEGVENGGVNRQETLG